MSGWRRLRTRRSGALATLRGRASRRLTSVRHISGYSRDVSRVCTTARAGGVHRHDREQLPHHCTQRPAVSRGSLLNSGSCLPNTGALRRPAVGRRRPPPAGTVHQQPRAPLPTVLSPSAGPFRNPGAVSRLRYFVVLSPWGQPRATPKRILGPSAVSRLRYFVVLSHEARLGF